jgi:ankyrin repeat protein
MFGLTRAMFGLGNKSLQDVIRDGLWDKSTNGDDINAHDTFGLTACTGPLLEAKSMWLKTATARSCSKHSKHHGADSFHIAAQYNATEYIDMLYEARAQSLPGHARQLPIHTAYYYGQVDALKAFVSRGESVESRKPYKRTFLHLAALNNQTAIMEYLFSISANINAQDINGAMSLALVNEFNRYPGTKAQQAKGANYMIKSFGGPQFYHFAAGSSDATMMQILASRSLRVGRP